MVVQASLGLHDEDSIAITVVQQISELSDQLTRFAKVEQFRSACICSNIPVKSADYHCAANTNAAASS